MRRASKGLQTSIVFTLLDKLDSTAAGGNGSGWNIPQSTAKPMLNNKPRIEFKMDDRADPIRDE